MEDVIVRLTNYCLDNPAYADNAINTVEYALRTYGWNKSREFWRDLILGDDAKLALMLMSYSQFYNIMGARDE